MSISRVPKIFVATYVQKVKEEQLRMEYHLLRAGFTDREVLCASRAYFRQSINDLESGLPEVSKMSQRSIEMLESNMFPNRGSNVLFDRNAKVTDKLDIQKFFSLVRSKRDWPINKLVYAASR